MDNISVFEAKLPAVGEVTDIPPLDAYEARSRHKGLIQYARTSTDLDSLYSVPWLAFHASGPYTAM